MAGAPLGALTTGRMGTRLFTGILAAVILLAGLRMIIVEGVVCVEPAARRTRTMVGAALIGLVIGFMGGMLGIGGGVFVVPLLIYVLKVPTKTAAATSIFIVCFSSFSGFVTHAMNTHIDWGPVLLLALASFSGGQIGSRIMAEKLRGRTVRIIFGCVLIALAATLGWSIHDWS